MERYIVLNCGYGNSPYLRSAEIALAAIELLNGKWKIIVPEMYGDKQRRIMQEEFGDQEAFVFDAPFGDLHASLFFTGEPYAKFLKHWTENIDEVSNRANRYLQQTYGDRIAMEISRAPLLHLNVGEKYYNSFTKTSDILNASIGNAAIAVPDEVLKTAASRMSALEQSYDTRFISVPGTFEPNANDIAIPLSTKEKSFDLDIEPGIYVTCSGIPHAPSLQRITDSFDLPIYTNDTAKIVGGIRMSPDVLASGKIVAHIGRAGWGSVWMSLMTETPFITPEYNANDDPEIFYNNRRLNELGIGAVWKNQSLEEIHAIKPQISLYNNKLKERFKGKNGAVMAARKIAGLEV